MRTAFIETLEELAAKDKKIFLLNGDLGFSVLEKFTRKFPRRSFNMGVAEANMMGVAAGLALSGQTVFVYSIIPFVTARVFEQVRNDVVLQDANVKIVGVGAGLSYGQLGPTHHSIEDIALMRTLPGMTILCPGDPWETRVLTQAAAHLKGPVYLRLGMKGEPLVHEKKPALRIGKGFLVRHGSDATIITTSNMLKTGVEVCELLAKQNLHIRLISLHTIKPFDAGMVRKAARETQMIFTIEEHSTIGGLGSAVAEVLAEQTGAVRHFYRFGIKDVVTQRSGSQKYLREMHKLAPEAISKTILQILSS